MPLIECQICHAPQFDPDLRQCRACGIMFAVMGKDDAAVDERALAGILNNAKVLLMELQPHEFQQIMGVFGPGSEGSEGIPFTAETCAQTHHHLAENAILCCRIDISLGSQVQHSLVIAQTESGLIRAVGEARAAATKMGAKIEVTS